MDKPSTPGPRTSEPSQSAMVPQPEPKPQPDIESWPTPWVQLKYYRFHPCIYPTMIRRASPDARAGQLVAVYDREGKPFGAGLYNPKARVPLRVVHHGREPMTEDALMGLLDRAIDARLGLWRLRDRTDAFRVVHSDGDGLSGLIVDQYADVLSVSVHSLAVWQRLPKWLPHLQQRLEAKRVVVEVDSDVARIEGIRRTRNLNDRVQSVRIREHGVRYEIDFPDGHKTGFFCDQRENRRRFAGYAAGKRVLDLCCYTGGFALSAKVKGKAEEVTGVDLDEKAVAQARRNANLNQVRVDWVHVDAFSYARQMQQNGDQWGAVALDPPKLLTSRDDVEKGIRRYEDLNRLAVSLVSPGGLFLTCSCSGLLSPEEFERIVVKAAHRQRRKLQIFDWTGAGPDHPVMSNCPESRYLKAIWARVW